MNVASLGAGQDLRTTSIQSLTAQLADTCQHCS
jgi:hypothetical protein